MKIIVPPDQIVFRKNEWYLLYDPQNINWVKMNEAGYQIIEQLAETPDLAQATDIMVEKYGMDRASITNFVDCMIDVGYLSRESYVRKTPLRMVLGKSYPDVLYLHMTYQCNLSCEYCYNSDERKRFMEQSSFGELSDAEFKNLIAEAGEIGIRKIVFTGGEPLLNKAIFDIAEFSKSIGLYNSIITNGTLISAGNVSLVSNLFHHISVSIDSHMPELNNIMRGPTTFERAMRGLELLLREGANVSVLGVVHDHNIDTVLTTEQYFREELNCPFLAQLYVPEGTQEEELDKVREIYDKYAEIRSAINATNCSFKGMAITPLCGMCNGEIAVGANGDVFPCQSLLGEHFCGGNLKQRSLREILDGSERFRELRELSVDCFDMCKDCDFKYLCSGGCRAVHYGLTGDLRKTDPDICHMNKRLVLELMWNSACKSLEQKSGVQTGELT